MSEDKKKETDIATQPKPKKPNTNDDGSGDGAPDGTPGLKRGKKKDESKEVTKKAEIKSERKPIPTPTQSSSTGIRTVDGLNIPTPLPKEDEDEYY